MTFVLAAAAVGVSLGLNRATEAAPSWVETPSAMAVFGVLFILFERVAWRWGFLRGWGVVRVPNLGGEWTGHLTTSFDEHAEQMPVTATIAQSWRSISVVLGTGNSDSTSISASLLVGNPADTLSYEYRNEPRPQAPSDMQAHRGTATLTIRSNGTLEGQYYTGRGRGTFGSITLARRTA